MSDDPLSLHYQKAAYEAVIKMKMGEINVANVTKVAADAAVVADRQRIAEQLRARVIFQLKDELPRDIAMKVDSLMFQLADQIENGLPITRNEMDGPDDPTNPRQ